MRFASLEMLDDIAPATARAALSRAAADLTERGFASAAHWALELLYCVPPPAEARPAAATPRTKGAAGVFPTHSTPAIGLTSPSWDHTGDGTPSTAGGDAGGRVWSAGTWPHASPALSVDALASPAPPQHARVRFDAQEGAGAPPAAPGDDERRTAVLSTPFSPAYTLAKSCFDMGQYDRCAWLLDQEGSLSAKGRTIQLLAKYRVFQRELGESGDAVPALAYAESGPSSAARAHARRGTEGRPSLIPLLEYLVDPADAYLLFLKGVFLRRLHKRVEAMDCLLRSVCAFPYNWSAWEELARTMGAEEREQTLDLLPNSFMSVFFLEYAARQSTQADTANLERIDALLAYFPDSAYLLTARAQSLYLHQELDEAAEIFQQALQLDPYRLDGISEYSNTLYVLDHADALAQLVQRFARVGEDRPEVCCLIGNYYNQRSDHFRAVESFKRALRLDSDCVAAWILLGHEYLELKNSHAAAEMYRRALEINPQDYRPWHGLGQVYELNEAWSYAVHYYQKCAAIRPYDARMWASLGVCYDRLGRTADAVACFKRHLTCPLTQMESVDAIARIIDLYERDGDTVNSTMFHCLLVQVVDQSMAGVDPALVARFVFSYLIAARWEMGELHGKLFYSKQDQRLRRPASTRAPKVGNLALAREYLHKVVLAGTEMTLLAEELLKKMGGGAGGG
ncbi:Anaphase-promoting complex subunit 8 [Malassezia sp. CBS 17886]|nr:Anaphase-promoting complex subunit 8 [Malassezia sp. CBS 17886]